MNWASWPRWNLKRRPDLELSWESQRTYQTNSWGKYPMNPPKSCIIILSGSWEVWPWHDRVLSSVRTAQWIRVVGLSHHGTSSPLSPFWKIICLPWTFIKSNCVTSPIYLEPLGLQGLTGLQMQSLASATQRSF